MSRSLNKVLLIGHLGKDPELRYTSGGTAVANFSLATNEGYKDDAGNWQDKTEWHSIVAWKKNAEIAGEYLKKGARVYIEGKNQTRSYDDKDGNKRYMHEIVAFELIMLDGKGDAPADAPKPSGDAPKKAEEPDSLPF